MSAQTGPEQLDKIESYIKIAEEDDKANILTGGHRITDNGLDKGYFFEPTIIEINDNKHQLAQEEIFGPVVVVEKFDDEQEAIEIANDSEYGLAGGIFTTDIHRALNVAKAMRTGRIWINTYNQIPAGAPFGGYKKSGIGREVYKDKLKISLLIQATKLKVYINKTRHFTGCMRMRASCFLLKFYFN